MQKFSITVLVSFYLSILFSYSATVKGVIKNGQPGMLVSINYFQHDFDGKEVKDEMNLGKDSTFSLELSMPKAKIVTFSVATFTQVLFLRPDDHLNIHVDMDDFEGSIKFTGTNAYDNTYLIEEIKEGLSPKFINPSMFNDTLYFRQCIDTIEKANREFYAKHDSTLFSADFRNYMRAELKYRYTNLRYMFSYTYDIVIHNFKKRVLPDGYWNYLKNLNLNDQNAINNSSYQVCLIRYIEMFVKDSIAALEKDSSDIHLQRKRILNRTVDDYEKRFKGRVYDYTMTFLLNNNLNLLTVDKKYGDQIINSFAKKCSTPEYVSFIRAKYESVFRLNAGEPAPDFVFTELNGKRTSLSSLKGKYVFMDVWASWCGPCVEVYPMLQQCTADPRFKNVTFVFVNSNDDENRWKNFLKNNGDKGLHLFADHKESIDLQSLYEIDALPRSILIDPKGKIIDAFFLFSTPDDILKGFKLN